MNMDKQDPAVKEIVEKMKATARMNAWVPFGPSPRECYYHFKNGLNLYLTVDILTQSYVNTMARLFGVKYPEDLTSGTRF